MTSSSVYTGPAEHDAYVVPASFAQQGLFLLQLEQQSVAYNLQFALYISQPLDVAALEQSLNAIVQRHEVLRTRLVVSNGQLLQQIAATSRISLPVADLQWLTQTQREAEVLRLATHQVQQPFDLAHGPLLRTTLVRMGAAEQILLVTVHHIIFDSWSIGLFFHELHVLYEAFSTGQPATLPELPIQYADCAVRQRECLQEEILSEQLAYWKQQLAGAAALLELPTDRPRPPLPSSRGSMYRFALSKRLTEALKALSCEQGVSVFVTLAAAFQTLLHRYTGQDDLLLGTVISDRKDPQVQKLIGGFFNTLMLRTDLSGNPTFRELLERVREVTSQAYAHSDVPFEYVVRALQAEQNLTQNPLIQVMLIFEAPQLVLPPEWSVIQVEAETGTSRFDLSLTFEDHPEGFIGRFEYSTDLFDRAAIARIAGHCQMLFDGIVADSEQHLSELPLLREAERQLLLVEWNDTTTDYPKNQCLHQLFEAQAERTPDTVAVVFEEQRLTYRELNARANQLAHHLQVLGVGPEVLVGICMERSLEMIVGLLGILKAGGAYVPLDPAYPPDRLAFMLEDTKAPVLLTQQRLIERLPPTQEKVICVDTEWKVIAQESKTNVVTSLTSENLAYVIYTSGSTGRPKGVLGTHRAAINRFHWMWTTYPFEAEEVCCQKTSLSFVDSVWEIFGPLLQGIRTVIIPDQVVKDPQRMIQTLAAYAITRIVLVPSLLRRLLDAHADLQNQLFRLKYWVSSGEALPLELALRFLNSMPHSLLLNLYGSSEVAADATYYDTRSCKALRSVPIGRPIANTQIYLLDRHMQLVPIGVPAELYVGGDGLARGYFNRPELTTEKFVPNPFSTAPGALLYKTGDWARYLPDGNIEYLGRLDHQVKLRGKRIELGEIEAVLGQHPAVRQAVVVVREDIPGDKRLVAYVILHQDQIATDVELQSHARQYLPYYMVPSVFVLLETFPLSPNGKIDRTALFQLPSSPTQAILSSNI